MTGQWGFSDGRMVHLPGGVLRYWREQFQHLDHGRSLARSGCRLRFCRGAVMDHIAVALLAGWLSFLSYWVGYVMGRISK